jgi:hypothetical protein
MIRENLKTFFDLAAERYRIYLNRNELRLSSPWTQDPIYQKYRFCNVFREDDKTTVWFRDTLRNPLDTNATKVLFATIAFRWFNRISTGKLISGNLMEGPSKWDPRKIREILKDKKPVVTGAYIIKTPNGMNKLDGVLFCIEEVRADIDALTDHLAFNCKTLESMWERLREYPYLGDFMAYEVVTDLRYTLLGRDAQDIDLWCNPGPGCTRGLGWVISGNFEQFNRGSRKDRAEMLPLMQEILLASRSDEYWPRQFCRSWDMRTVEHWLCETTKYIRVRDGGSPPKERFKS